MTNKLHHMIQFRCHNNMPFFTVIFIEASILALMYVSKQRSKLGWFGISQDLIRATCCPFYLIDHLMKANPEILTKAQLT